MHKLFVYDCYCLLLFPKIDPMRFKYKHYDIPETINFAEFAYTPKCTSLHNVAWVSTQMPIMICRLQNNAVHSKVPKALLFKIQKRKLDFVRYSMHVT